MSGATARATPTGEITTKFEWKPDQDKPNEPFPKNVIITEYSSVKGMGTSTKNDRGSFGVRPTVPIAKNGINTPAIPLYEYQGGNEWTLTQSDLGSKSRIVPGTNPLVVKCTVDALGEAVAPQYGSAYAEVNVAYKVEVVGAFNGKIEITGTTADGNTVKVLIGQGLHAKVIDCTLVTGTLPNWSFAPRADICFGSFDHGAVGQENPVNFALQEIDFFTKGVGTVKVKATVQVVLPDTSIGSVTLESIDVSSVKPTANWGSSNNVHGIDLNPGPSQYSVWANTIWHPISITVPSPFAGGKGCIAQIITPLRTNERVIMPGLSGDTLYVAKQQTPPSSGTWVRVNGKPGHDDPFPYAGIYNSLGVRTGASDRNVGDDVYSGDQPRHFLQPNDVEGGGDDWRKGYANDSFKTWLMYQPVAVVTSAKTFPVSWVPLQKREWDWIGEATRPSKIDQWSQTQGKVDAGDAAATNIFPDWIWIHLAADRWMRPNTEPTP